MIKVIVCRRQNLNLEMEAAVAGPPLPAVAQDGDGAPPGDLPSCNICDKTFKTINDVKKHQRCHFEGKYQCHICGKKYKTPGNRNVHLRQVHGDAKFDCKLCDKSYQSQAALKKHVKKKHAGDEDLLERQLEEDPDLTLEALEGGEGMEPGEVQEMTLDVSDKMTHGRVVSRRKEEEEVLVLPGMDAEASAATSDTSDLDTVFKSCFQRDRITSDTNNNVNDCTISIYIGDKIVKVSGEEELVLTVGTLAHDYFYPVEEEDGLVEAAPLSPALASNDTEEMETGHSALASDGIGDEEAALTGPALAADQTEKNPTLASDMGSDYAGYAGAQEAAMPVLASDMGNPGYAEAGEETETVTEVQESVLPAQDEVAGDDADNGAGEADNIVTEASSSTVGQSGKAEKRFKCTVCEKSYARKQYLREHQKAHLFRQNFKCTKCDKSFNHKCILKQHEQEKHASDEDKILCPKCGKQFRSQTNLKNHMVLHDKKDEKYSKELKQEALQLIKKIGKAETARKLKIPYSAIVRWETQNKMSFSCSICGKELSEYSKLKKHEMKVHGKMSD